MTKLLIDGDIISYTAAFHAQANRGTEEEAAFKIDTTMRWCIARLGASSYQVYLTGKDNFRMTVSKTYKGNRTAPKPDLLPYCREYLRWNWNAIVSRGEEADDLIAIEAARLGYKDCIIASIDKDFLQVPVPMYNWKKDTLVLVTPEGGLRFFYKQIIMGDGADNIKGAKGVGPKGAEKALDGLNDEREMYDKCVDIYKSVGMTEEEVISNARLLWLRREIGEIWEPPNENQKKGEG